MTNLKELTRSKIYRGPYDAPNTEFFNSFCDDLVDRYHLSEASWFTASVQHITPIDPHELPAAIRPDEHRKLFRVQLDNGRVIHAQRVVLAPGPLNIPRWPDFYQNFDDSFLSNLPPEKLLHSCDIMKADRGRFDANFNAKRLLVLGGGLTAGHLMLAALRNNVGIYSTLSLSLCLSSLFPCVT